MMFWILALLFVAAMATLGGLAAGALYDRFHGESPL